MIIDTWKKAIVFGIALFIAGVAGNVMFNRNNNLEWLFAASVVLPIAALWLSRGAKHIDSLEDRIRELEARIERQSEWLSDLERKSRDRY